MAVLKWLALAHFYAGLYHSAGRVPDTLSLSLIVLAFVLFALGVAWPRRQAVRA